MEISFASTLLVTHSKFADVYSLFEESVEEMDPSLVENFMRDVAGIKSKLDTWITLLHYEKEKKTFLDQQNIHRGSTTESVHDSKDAVSQQGSMSNESACFSTGASSENRRSVMMNNAPTPEETLPLVLESDNDESWLVSAPTPLPRPREETSDFMDSLKSPEERASSQTTCSAKTVHFKQQTLTKTRIPKPPPSPHRKGALHGFARDMGTDSAGQHVERGVQLESFGICRKCGNLY